MLLGTLGVYHRANSGEAPMGAAMHAGRGGAMKGKREGEGVSKITNICIIFSFCENNLTLKYNFSKPKGAIRPFFFIEKREV